MAEMAEGALLRVDGSEKDDTVPMPWDEDVLADKGGI